MGAKIKTYAGTPEAPTHHQPSQDWQVASVATSTAPVAVDSSAQGALLSADSLEPQAMLTEPAQSQHTQEQQVNGCLHSLQDVFGVFD